MVEFRLYKSPKKALQLLLGCAAFVAISCVMLGRPDAPQWVAWAGIGFFSLGFPVGIYQLLDRKPQIIVNEFGVFDRHSHHEFINWEIIQDVYVATVHNHSIICLVVDEAFEPSRRKSRLEQGVARVNKEMGFQELNIALGFVSVDAMRFAEFILAMRNAERPVREELVQQAIANL